MAFPERLAMAPGAGGSSAVPSDRYDADRLLAGYQTARAQEALFDLRHGPGIGYDEFVDREGNVRATWSELADAVAERGRAGLDRLRSVVDSLIDNDGITYTEVDSGRGATARSHGAEPGPWRLDPLP